MIDIYILSERQNHRCAYCGIVMTLDTAIVVWSSATRDHYIPRTRDGAHTEENLIAACMHCNSWRGNKNALHFFSKVQVLLRTAARRVTELENMIEKLCAAQAQTPCKNRRRYLRYTRRQLKHLRYYAR